MRFDTFGEDDSVGLFADGDHQVEIVKVKTVTRNRDGQECSIVTLRDLNGTFEDLERWFDPTEKRDCKLALKLLNALGLPSSAEIDQEVVGRRVVVTTKQGVNKSTGQAVVYVNAFAAAPGAPAFESYREPEPAKPVAKRTPTQQADAASGVMPNDDIPF
jgi:hypothetical protein